MTRDTNQHREDWDEQRERLSAYLDDELGAAERAALERHLPGCARCQAELADLRGVRALLRALPTPVAPRSFALPDEGAVPQPIAPSVARRSARPLTTGVLARAMEWAGSVAAVAGLLLLLGTALGSGPHGGAASTTAGSSGQLAPRTATAQAGQQGPKAGADGAGGTTSPTQPTQPTLPTPRQTRPSVVTAPGGERTPGATPGSPETPAPGASTPTHTTTPASTPHIIQPGPNTSISTGENRPAGDGLPLAGVGLILGGATLFAGGKVVGRRARRGSRGR